MTSSPETLPRPPHGGAHADGGGGERKDGADRHRGRELRRPHPRQRPPPARRPLRRPRATDAALRARRGRLRVRRPVVGRGRKGAGPGQCSRGRGRSDMFSTKVPPAPGWSGHEGKTVVRADPTRRTGAVGGSRDRTSASQHLNGTARRRAGSARRRCWPAVPAATAPRSRSWHGRKLSVAPELDAPTAVPPSKRPSLGRRRRGVPRRRRRRPTRRRRRRRRRRLPRRPRVAPCARPARHSGASRHMG